VNCKFGLDSLHKRQTNSKQNGNNSPKDAEFYSKNKFEKLMYLVSFIIRIYHDARSSERQINYTD